MQQASDIDRQAAYNAVIEAVKPHLITRRVKMNADEMRTWATYMADNLAHYRADQIISAFGEQLKTSRYFPQLHDILELLPDHGEGESAQSGGYYPKDAAGSYIPTDKFYVHVFMTHPDNVSWVQYCQHMFRKYDRYYIDEINKRRAFYGRKPIQEYSAEMVKMTFDEHFTEHAGVGKWVDEMRIAVKTGANA